ncbi:YhgE/Pip domain-containing protein [Eggerthellaceae bacterium 3-80]|nr:YhgE/Pip domain-containing protein [bacterium D16-34]
MRNMWLLIKDDFRRLFRNAISIIIVIGLVVLPSIFTWYNVIACWNVFENTGNLTVAVANTDEGYESDLIPLRINVGDQVLNALRANDQIDWRITDEEDAIDGARSGRYYAAVVIPKTFSKDMLTFYDDNAQHAEIIYYTNQKKSAIAPKITDQGADTVSYQVNEVFAETLSEVSLALVQGFSNFADETDMQGRIASLSEHVRTMATRIDDAASVLALYATLTESVDSLNATTLELLQSADQNLTNLTATAQNGVDTIKSTLGQLDGSTDSITQALEAVQARYDELSGQIGTLFDETSIESGEASAKLRTVAGLVDAQITDLQSRLSALEEIKEQLPEDTTEGVTAALDGVAERMQTIQDKLTVIRDNLNNAADKIDAGVADVSTEREKVESLIAEAKQGVLDIKTDYEQNLKPTLQQLTSDAQTFANNLDSGLSEAHTAESNVENTLGATSVSMGDASTKINDSVARLHEVSEKMRSLADRIDESLATGDTLSLQELFTSDIETLSLALAAPVGVHREAVFPVENFGSAMTPLYTSLALFIGSLLIMVALKPHPLKEQVALLHNPKPRQLFLGHFVVVAFLSLMQTTLMGLGNIFFLQVQAVHPWLLMICFWVSGLVLVFLIYSLVAAFANLGKAITVLLLIVQVTGCGGSFPLQLLPWFVQEISPYLPLTHVVNAMRAAMMGTYGNDFWIQIGQLCLFLIPAALIGLVLRKPLAKFMEWYVEKVESTKLIG